MLRCYSAAAPMFDPPIERVEFPYQGTFMAGWLRKPRNAGQSSYRSGFVSTKNSHRAISATNDCCVFRNRSERSFAPPIATMSGSGRRLPWDKLIPSHWSLKTTSFSG